MNCNHLKTKAGLQLGLPTKTNIGNQFIIVSWSKQAMGKKQWAEHEIYIEHKKYVYKF